MKELYESINVVIDLLSALWQNVYLRDELRSCKVKIIDRSSTLSIKNVVLDYLKCKLQSLDDILGFLSLEVLKRTSEITH